MPRGCGKKALLAMAAMFAFFTMPFLLLMLNAIATGGTVIWLLITTVMFAMPALLFLFLGLRQPQERPLTMNKSIERQVLHLAAVNDGELTASKLALGSQLRLDECQQVLEEFEAMGVARGIVGSGGEIRYTFPELQESMAGQEDDFMRRLLEEDPRSVLDFDVSDRAGEAQKEIGVGRRHEHKK